MKKILFLILSLTSTLFADDLTNYIDKQLSNDYMRDACIKSIYYPDKSFTYGESEKHSRMIGIAEGYLLANGLEEKEITKYWQLMHFSCKDALENNSNKIFLLKYRKSIKKIAKEFYGI